MQAQSTKKSAAQGEDVDIDWEEKWDDAWDNFCDECRAKGQKELVVFAKYIPQINKDLENEMDELASRLTIEEINLLTAKLTGKK